MPDKNEQNVFKEAVCVDAMRVFDSCSSQDCLEDLELTFTTAAQETVDNALYIKTKCVDCVGAAFAIDPVPFNKGFYTVDVTYTFRAEVEAYTAQGEPPTVIYGSCTFTKRVILFGSDGNTQRFASNTTTVPVLPSATSGCAECCDMGELPVAAVSIVPPMCLNASLVTGETGNTVQITIGVFSIIQLERPVPIMIPAYDYSIPERECSTNTDTPCELFEKIPFPVAEFFPQGLEPEPAPEGNQPK
ncbi:MAG: hypothetical protein IKO44_02025 [Ruminococcus sp.]|nr:hypothetical protein [Ruminococcus sp.]